MDSCLRLMTHNVWNCEDNQPAWAAIGRDCSAEARVPGLLRVYHELLPDVIGCQESKGRIARLICEGLQKENENYRMIDGDFTSVFYRADKFTLIESDFYRYPNEMEGYEGIFNDAGSKSYCIGVFEEKASGKRFIFASTHLWWMKSPTEDMTPPYPGNYQLGSDEARAFQMGLLIERLEKFREQYGCPAFIVGDLNASYDSAAVQRAFAAGYRHAHDVATDYADDAVGYHYCFADGFKEEYYDKPFEWAIDHILVIGEKEGAIKRFARYSPDYYFPISDHSPAYADILL